MLAGMSLGTELKRFSRGAMLDSAALKDVAVRRLKRDLTGKGFKDRQVKTLTFIPDHTEQEMFSLLDDIVTRSAKLNGTKPGGDIVAAVMALTRDGGPRPCAVVVGSGGALERVAQA